MDLKKIGLATLGGGVTLFLTGFLVWGIVLDKLHQDHVTQYEGLVKEIPNMALLGVAMVVFALLLAIIYERWANISTFRTGAIAGGLIAVLVGLNQGIMTMAFQNLFDWVIVGTDIFGNMVWGGLGGGVIGWILGKFD